MQSNLNNSSIFGTTEVLDMSSSNYRELHVNTAPGQEANGDNLEMYARSSVIMVC